MISIDDVFTILSNSRRRAVISALMDEGQLTKRELIDRVTASETDVPVPEIESDERRRVQITLHQTHLPKLEDYGVIEEIGEDNYVLGDCARKAETVLQSISGDETTIEITINR